MHSYSVDGVKREVFIYYIALVSVLITPFINCLLGAGVSLIKQYATISYTITSITVFSVLYYIFNRWLWKKITLSKIPYIGGTWRIIAESAMYNSSTKFNWEATMEIVQNWDTISIIQNTKDSDSYSTSIIGGIKVEGNGNVLLSYVYTNNPRNSTPNLKRHEGLAKIVFNKPYKTGIGDYFNDQERKTYGTMRLEKI